MARFAIFSDLHLHPWVQFASFDENGLNTRLMDVANTLHWILSEAEKAKCDAVLFAGDFWHTKKIDIETLHIAAETLEKTNIPLVMIPGNHDEADKLGRFYASKVLKGRATILDLDSDGVTIAGTRIVGLPYIGNNFGEALRNQIEDCGEPDILLLHAPVADALMGSDFLTHEGEGVDQEKLLNEAPLTVVGHYHQSQLFHPDDSDKVSIPHKDDSLYHVEGHAVLIPGSPLQHNISDRGSARGFWIYEENFLTFYESKAPKFLVLTAEEASKLAKEEFENNFITITAEDQRDAEKAAGKITNARGVLYGTSEKKVLEHKERISFNAKCDIPDVIKKYCEYYKEMKQEVYDLGVSILKEARKQ